MTQYGVKALGIAADVSNADDIARALAEIEQAFGGADILINNAGTGTQRDHHGCTGREVAALTGTCT